MDERNIEDLQTAIAALEAQRDTLGHETLQLALAPLRSRLAGLLPPAGLQHRQVTVLFADVVDAGAEASGLDPEDASEPVLAALRGMAAVIEAHQGRVLRSAGAGVKAAFGVHAAREDDAERAVRAGLAILQSAREQAGAALRRPAGAGLAVRVGVHTGNVALGAGVEADNTAMGAAVNIAARMMQTAPPGALRISHDTWSQVRGLFVMDAQPPLHLKGVDAPQQTYLVRAALDRSLASVERGVHGLRAPIIGRDAELQRLLDLPALARQTRQLQAVTLIADAGLGKSRLLRETAGRLGDGLVLTLRSQPDGLLRPWGLLRTLLATQCAVADTDSAEVARAKVVDGLSPWFPQRGPAQAQLIGQLSGLDFGDSPHVHGLDPRSLRDEAFAALRGYLQALAAAGDAPPVLLLEDLHWADDGSLDLLQDWLAHAAELPLVLLMTARPALLTRRPGWAAPEATVTLQPLSAAQGDALAQALLQRIEAPPARLVELLVGRAEGNPYYMEELLRRLIDDGVIVEHGPHWRVHADRLDGLRLPGTLVGLLQARLDALPAAARQAARQASVIGHVFWDDALRALDAEAPAALPALQSATFVRSHAHSDFEGTPERQFDHHLLHQVTYDTLLKAERRLGHGAAARWLAERTRGRGAEFLAMTGEHAERAGETALAIDCFEQAGAEAQRRYANAAASAWLRRALGLLGESQPARRFALFDRLDEIASVVGDQAGQEAIHREVAALLERHPDDTRQAQLWFDMALLADHRGDVATAESLSWKCLDLAERCGAALWAAMALGNLAYRHYDRQDYVGAGEHLARALQWAARIEPEFECRLTEAKLLTISAMVSEDLCRLDEARETLLGVLSRGVALGTRRLQLAAIDNLANVAGTLGRWAEKAEWGQRMLELAGTIGAVPRMAGAQHHLACAAEGLGDLRVAIERAGQALAHARASGRRPIEVAALHRLGALHLDTGDAAAALPWLAQAQALYRELGNPVGECEAAAGAAACELRLGQREAARSGVGRLLDRLAGDLSGRAAHETIALRWSCSQLLAELADARAEPMLAPLHADVQARAAALTAADDRERLIQALPVWRAIAAAARRRAPGEPASLG